MHKPFGRCLLTAGLLLAGTLFATLVARLAADEPATINPFGNTPTAREDSISGTIKLSDGAVYAGQIYLTRDKRFQIYDEKIQRQREVPLSAVKQVDCIVKREWLEKEWKFKETTNDEKMYTGRSYPAREYLHKITLKSGQTITGPMSAIIYVQTPQASGDRQKDQDVPDDRRFVLHKRDKGSNGQDLKSLVYVQWIKLESGKE